MHKYSCVSDFILSGLRWMQSETAPFGISVAFLRTEQVLFPFTLVILYLLKLK